MMNKIIVLATSNVGKINEFSDLFQNCGLTFLPQTHFKIDDAIEDGSTFVQNALIKAQHAATISKYPAIADDSGLIVDALQGAPGIFSARYAGTHGDAQANIQKVLTKLREVPESHRTARFHCCLVFIEHANDPTPIICSANWEGRILFEPQGKAGFGYDPIFYVPEQQSSAAALSMAIKNKISHRAQAMALLKTKLVEKYGDDTIIN
jgi:XTP/dITP diphosphohydrolase